MNVIIITHDSGYQLPMLLDNDRLPIITPNEFIFGRRHLSTNTLTRNLREVSFLHLWLEKSNIDLKTRICNRKPFSEAEIKGSLIEFIRLKQIHSTKKQKSTVSPVTFNQRLITIRQYFLWCFDIYTASYTTSSKIYNQINLNKNKLIHLIETSFINAPPSNNNITKGLSLSETDYLISILDPNNDQAYGRNKAVQYRNYILTLIMLLYGLRPGEVLCLKVEDITIGAISSISVHRRSPDIKDTRRPRPQIKRNGRILPIDDLVFAKILDDYIIKWRDILEESSEVESEYLILSDDGKPLSQASICQLYQILRKKYSDNLPQHLTAKALRHSFSSQMEIILRRAGVEEDKRKQALAYLRGDSSLTSQDVYIAQEIEEQANVALKKYQIKLSNYEK